MSEGNSNENADYEDSHRTQQNLIFGNRAVRAGIEFFSGLVFYVIGDDFTNWGLVYWGFFFHYCSIIFGALIVADQAASSWPRAKKRIWFVYGVSCLILALFYTWFSWPKPAFKIISRIQSVARQNARTMLFLNNNGRDVLLPIPIEIYADFINNTASPMTIRSYQFEGKTAKNIWVEMATINPDFGRVLWFTGAKVDQAHPILEKSFGNNVWPRRIAGKQIGPGETVPSVILLDIPKEGFDGTLRLRVKDSFDKEYVGYVVNGVTNEAATSAIGDDFTTFLGKAIVDISRAITNRYSDEMH